MISRMYRILKYLLPLLLISACSSASNELQKKIKEFKECSIIVPDDMLILKGRTESSADKILNDSMPKFIIYYDSLSCNSCQVSHLFELTSLYGLADSSEAFEVMTIFSPKTEEYDELMKELMVRNFDYTLFIDASGSFRRLNRDIPEDVRFHSFLIDEEAHPVFVGNPVESYDLWILFNKFLKNYEEKK